MHSILLVEVINEKLKKRPSNNKKLGGFFFVYKIRSKREFSYKIVLQVAPTNL